MAVVLSFVGKWNGNDLKRAEQEIARVRGTAGQAGTQMGFLSRQTADFGATFRKSLFGLGAGLAAGVGFSAIKDQIGQAIAAGSDLAESQGKVRVVFGQSAYSIQRWAKTASTSVLLSERAAAEAAGTFGNLWTALGMGEGQAARLSTSAVQLAADLASFNDRDVVDTLAAVRSGLVGETEPLRALGININAARIKQEALNAKLWDGKGALSAAAQAQAALNLMYADAENAIGDVARTADGYANTMRAVDAAVDNAKASIGMGFVNAVGNASDAMGGPNGLVQFIESAGRGLGGTVEQAGSLAAKIQQINDEARKNDTEPDQYDESGYRKIVGVIPIVGTYLTMLSDKSEESARATGQMELATLAAGQSAQDVQATHRALAAQLVLGAKAADTQKASLDRLNDALSKSKGHLDHMSARASVEAAILAFDDLDQVKTSTTKDKHGKVQTKTWTEEFRTRWDPQRHTFAFNTEEGQKGWQAALALIEATRSEADTEKSLDAKTATYKHGRRALVHELVDMGVERPEARRFARGALGTPPAIQSSSVNNVYNFTGDMIVPSSAAATEEARRRVRLAARSTRPREFPGPVAPQH